METSVRVCVWVARINTCHVFPFVILSVRPLSLLLLPSTAFRHNATFSFNFCQWKEKCVWPICACLSSLSFLCHSSFAHVLAARLSSLVRLVLSQLLDFSAALFIASLSFPFSTDKTRQKQQYQHFIASSSQILISYAKMILRATSIRLGLLFLVSTQKRLFQKLTCLQFEFRWFALKRRKKRDFSLYLIGKEIETVALLMTERFVWQIHLTENGKILS